jgi:hypothetical protein
MGVTHILDLHSNLDCVIQTSSAMYMLRKFNVPLVQDQSLVSVCYTIQTPSRPPIRAGFGFLQIG